jgi:hypothetical protein
MSLSLGDEICTYLQGQSIGLNFNGAGTINCFSTLLPDQPDLAVAIIERGGLPTVTWLTGPGGRSTTFVPPVNESLLDRPVFQVFTRSGMTGYTAGNTLVQKVFKALQGVVEETLNAGGSLFHLILSMQSPMYLGRDEKERHQWAQNFQVMWENEQRA